MTNKRHSLHRRRWPAVAGLAGVALACLGSLWLLTPPSFALQTRAGDGTLSPRLAELARPALRGAPRGEQARRLSVAPEGPGSLLREGDRVLADVRFQRGAVAAVGALRAAGARVIHVSRRYQTVTVAVGPAQLLELAEVAGVEDVTEILAPITSATDESPQATSSEPACFGAATTEGDVQLRAAEARQVFGVDGAGVTVGILSDSFNADGSAPTSAAQDVASGDLPGPGNPCGRSTPVNVLEDFHASDASDEGRAMAQIVHDLAPGAKLAYATAFKGENSFAANIERLAKPISEGGAAARVITDDVMYFNEPFFQDGPIAVAVANATAAGAIHFSSAGNNNLISAGRNIASWEAPAFRDAGGCPAGVPSYANACMDFDPGLDVDSTFGLTVSANATLRVGLQWAQPWHGVTTDFDAYLLSQAGADLAKSEELNPTNTQKPFEFLAWKNSTGAAQTVRLAINRCDTVCDGTDGGDTGTPRLKLVLLQNGGGVTATEYPESSGGDIVGPTIFGHNGTDSAISTGAVRFNTTSAPEAFSSRGPVTHYFGPVLGTTPASPLEAPRVLAKPDLVATNGGANTFFGQLVSGTWRFFGTSAAAPHGAAIAALISEADNSLAPGQIRESLVSTAQPVGIFGPNSVGAGIIDAAAALGEVAEPLPPEGGDEGGGSSPANDPEIQVAAAPLPSTTPSVVRQLPRAFFLQRPPRTVRTKHRRARVVFRFGSNVRPVRFVCRLNGAPWRFCKARFVKRLRVGRHVVRVKARDAAGNTTRPAAIHRFRVQRVRSG